MRGFAESCTNITFKEVKQDYSKRQKANKDKQNVEFEQICNFVIGIANHGREPIETGFYYPGIEEDEQD